MKTTQLKKLGGVLLLCWAGASAFGQAPVIASFGQNGRLVATNLLACSMASVEWASSVLGPWTNTWAGLDAVTVDSNGVLQVSVPMFYRVRGFPTGPTPTNCPSGMAYIPGGSFAMGDTLNDNTGGDEEPVHTVQVSAFYMDKHEVTKALWDDVYNWAIAHGYSFDNSGAGKAPTHPVQTVSWYDAVKWCNARSEKEGRTPAYYTSAAQATVYRNGQLTVDNSWVKWNAGYRLPTEAEWEKAARGGTGGHRFPWSDAYTITHSRANYISTSDYVYDTSPTRGYHPTFIQGSLYTSPVGYFACRSSCSRSAPTDPEALRVLVYGQSSSTRSAASRVACSNTGSIKIASPLATLEAPFDPVRPTISPSFTTIWGKIGACSNLAAESLAQPAVSDRTAMSC